MLIGLNWVCSSFDRLSTELKALLHIRWREYLISPSVFWSASFSWTSSCTFLSAASENSLPSMFQSVFPSHSWRSPIWFFFFLFEELPCWICTKPQNAIFKCTWMTDSWNFVGTRVPYSLQGQVFLDVVTGCVWISAQHHEWLSQCGGSFPGLLKIKRQVLFWRMGGLSFIWKASV